MQCYMYVEDCYILMVDLCWNYCSGHWHTLSHNVVWSTSRHEKDSNSKVKWWETLIRQAVVNSTTMESRPRRLRISNNSRASECLFINFTWRYDISEILLKVAINIITLIHTKQLILYYAIIYKYQHIHSVLYKMYNKHILVDTSKHWPQNIFQFL
jgi:hypothetical protein